MSIEVHLELSEVCVLESIIRAYYERCKEQRTPPSVFARSAERKLGDARWVSINEERSI